MQEVEIKLQVPAATARAVATQVAGRSPRPAQRLAAVYVDTAGRALAQAGLALRLRREGRRWVQALKGPGDDGLTRLEHEVPRLDAQGSEAPAPDPALHSASPVGERLRRLLDEHPGEALVPVFATDVRRRLRLLRRPGASLELAFDEGRIVSGDRDIPVRELEIELKSGPPAAVLAEARRWIDRHGVTFDARTKAERGELLSRGATQAGPTSARGAVLDAAMSEAQALRLLVRLCGNQVLRNASQIGTGEHTSDHVHQMRVGLRRLRTALRLFTPGDGEAPLADPSLADGLAALFRRLGAVRDADVLAEGTGALLDPVLADAGLAAVTPLLAQAVSPAGGSAADVVRGAASQQVLLDVIAAGLDDPAAPPVAADQPLRDRLAGRIGGWHRRASKDAARYAKLDDEARHALRKRIKRLRYAVEFSAALFTAKAVRRYLVPLKALQERLGELNDAVVALEAVSAARAQHPGDERLAFALGWLGARRDALIDRAAPELAAFAKAKPFWKN